MLAVDEAIPDHAAIHPGPRRRQPPGNLVLRHLQRDEEDRLPTLGDVRRYLGGKRRFPDAGPCREDHELSSLEAA
ncbi:hypothetical protein D3C86_1454090 [compost metagenome]